MKRIIAAAVVTLGLCAPVFAQDPLVVFVFDQNVDGVYRLQDLNADGDMLDAGEVTKFFDHTIPLIGIDNAQGLYALDPWTVLATDNFAPDDVVYMRDLNHDGDAFDAGEAYEWFNGNLPGGYHLTNPVNISAGPDDAFYVIDNNTLDTANPEAVYKLKDLNGDNDANDAGEVVKYFELSPAGISATTTFDVEFDAAGAGYVIDITDPNQIESVDRIAPGGGVKTEYMSSVTLYTLTGLVISGMYEMTYNPVTDEIILGAVAGNFDPYLIAIRDLNDSRTIDQQNEIRLLWAEPTNPDGVTAGSCRDFVRASDGSIVFVDSGQDQVVRLFDRNGDGDYRDLGETKILYKAALADPSLPQLPNLLSVGAVPLGPTLCAGDMNCDGAVDFKDINKFVEALSGQVAWEANPDNAGCPWLNGDIDADGNVTFKDINPFVAVLGTTCP